MNQLSHLDRSIKERALAENWPRYRIFGLTVASDLPLQDRLLPGQAEPDLFFTCQANSPDSKSWLGGQAIYTSRYLTPQGEPRYYIYRAEWGQVTRYTGFADCYFYQDTILVHTLENAAGELTAMNLLAPTVSFWLNQRGTPCLHASAVVIGDQAVAFIADAGHGKSTLATAFAASGFPLLTDDILPLKPADDQYWGLPAFPQIKLWPEEASQLLGKEAPLGVIRPGFPKRRASVGQGFGDFCETARPLACIYLLERRKTLSGEISVFISPVPQRDAAVEYVRYDFAALINQALGLAPQRLAFYTRLAQQVPLRRLLYPHGHPHLEAVRQAVLADLGFEAVPGNNDLWMQSK